MAQTFKPPHLQTALPKWPIYTLLGTNIRVSPFKSIPFELLEYTTRVAGAFDHNFHPPLVRQHLHETCGKMAGNIAEWATRTIWLLYLKGCATKKEQSDISNTVSTCTLWYTYIYIYHIYKYDIYIYIYIVEYKYQVNSLYM